MHFTKLPFDQFKNKVAEIFCNSLQNPVIIASTSRFGYDKAKIKGGEKLLKELEKINDKQNIAQDKKIKLHKERADLNLSVKKKYMKILLIARIAFDKDVIVKKALRLEGARETALDLWINQISVFANHLLGEADWLSILKKFGIERKELNSMLTELEKLRSATMLCEKAKTDAKKITEQKKIKTKELQQWVSDYLKIAKIALEDNPEVYLSLRGHKNFKIKEPAD